MIIQYQEFNGDIRQEEWDQWDVMGAKMAGVLAVLAATARSKVCCGYQRMLERAVILSCQIFSYWC